MIADDADDAQIERLTKFLVKALRDQTYVVAVVSEKDGEPSEQVARAAEFLKSLFPEFYEGVEPAAAMTVDGDGYSPVLVKDLEDLGEERGFSPDTLRRAREHLGWKVFKFKGVTSGPWHTHPQITKDDT